MWTDKQQASSEHPEDSMKAEIRLVIDSAGNGTHNPLLIMTEGLIRCRITLEFEDQMRERDGYGGTWFNEAIYPQYGCLGMAKIRRVCRGVRLEDDKIGEDLGELVNMCGRNRL